MKFDKDTITLIGMVLDLVIKYGRPAVETLMDLWANEDIDVTPELIQKRMDALPTPESFFND